MAPRAQWKGFLKFGEVSCGVALYTAASTSERITFNTVNSETGNRVRREFVDSETGDTVEREQQTKGYEFDEGQYVVIDPDEITAAIPDSDKKLVIDAFIACREIDDVYFDKPYYLTPSDASSNEAFTLLRDGMKTAKVAAIATAVLFRRMRTVLIRPHGRGLIATTLNFDYEVRASQEVFKSVPKVKIDKEMLDLTQHIISTKKGEFDPAEFDDRYDNAVAELVKAKIEGRTLPKKKPISVSRPNDLLSALRKSAGMTSGKNPSAANANSGAKKKTNSATRATRATPVKKAG